MCTLTYLLTECGYTLFFNRDEQRSRAQAIPPSINLPLNAIYPVDPNGQGTWIAVHQSGLSLALLNFYQAEKGVAAGEFLSRGGIILTLLKDPDNVINTLKSMPLTHFQAFQLCVFPADLNNTTNRLHCFQWDGRVLSEVIQTLPITSSSVDYPQVYKARKRRFEQIVNLENANTEMFIEYHQSQQSEGKLSVKMSRNDAKTVSFSQISVAEQIQYHYIDYLDEQQSTVHLQRINA